MRALVVEDEARTAALLRRGLEEEGYAVDMAADGPEAVWRANEFGYDVVILDVMLPGFDGFEVCRRLRSSGCWVPVLILTARNEPAERVRGLDCGADDYLAKPFSFDELFAQPMPPGWPIDATIGRTQSNEPGNLFTGTGPANIRFCRGQGVVSAGGGHPSNRWGTIASCAVGRSRTSKPCCWWSRIWCGGRPWWANRHGWLL